MRASQHAQRIDVDDDAFLEVGTSGDRLQQRVAEAFAVRAFDQELRAIFAAELAERRRRGSEDADVAALPRRPPELLHNIVRIIDRRRKRPRANHGVDHRHERRIAHRLAKVDLALVERRIVLLARELDAVVIGIERLDDRFAQLLAATGASGDLPQELKRSLGRSEVGDAEPDVRRYDADERDTRKVVTLRNHLRADEDVDLTRAELRQQGVERALAADGVAVQARDAGAGMNALHFRLDAFGAETGLLEIRSGAERTFVRHARGVVAIVTARAAGVALAMDDERDAAVRTVQRAGALTAEDRRREAATVQENQRLFVFREARRQSVAKRAAQNDIRSVGGVLLAHVDDRYGGERAVEDAALHDNPLELPCHRVVIRLHGRRRGSEDDERLRPLSPDDGDVASVVAGALFLLVAAVMLLVHDDQAD